MGEGTAHSPAAGRSYTWMDAPPSGCGRAATTTTCPPSTQQLVGFVNPIVSRWKNQTIGLERTRQEKWPRTTRVASYWKSWLVQGTEKMTHAWLPHLTLTKVCTCPFIPPSLDVRPRPLLCPRVCLGDCYVTVLK